jgi:hypothetical protein
MCTKRKAVEQDPAWKLILLVRNALRASSSREEQTRRARRKNQAVDTTGRTKNVQLHRSLAIRTKIKALKQKPAWKSILFMRND